VVKPFASLCRSLPLAACAALCHNRLRWQNMEGPMKRLLLAIFIFVTASFAFAQTDSPIPDNKALVSKAHSLYVQSDTFYMKRERLEGCLLKSPEFKTWNLQLTDNKQSADLLVEVKRIPFTNHFTYTVTDRNTDIIVMAGKVDSLEGTVYQLISDSIIHNMKEFRGDPLPHESQKKDKENQ
jgi:hypothetical protein